MVCYDMSKEDLYSVLETLYNLGIFVIPIYTKGIKDIPIFSDEPKSEYFIKPFYAGGNSDIIEGYLSKTVDMLSFDDYLAWKPVRDYVYEQVREKGWKETMRVKYPNSL